jgi:hypothetical protein
LPAAGRKMVLKRLCLFAILLLCDWPVLMLAILWGKKKKDNL